MQSVQRSALHARRWPVPVAVDRPQLRGSSDRRVRCAITVDLHSDDDARNIESAAIWLAEQRISATFFVPSPMFDNPAMATALRTLPTLGHEVGSHAHEHNYAEVHALISGRIDELGFLSVSRDLFSSFYGTTPRAFRSPLWCYVGHSARRELVRLGYQIDSSATPQRLKFLSSLPFEPGWSTSPRGPHFWSEGLLEIPTTSLVQPASIATFTTLRSGAGAFLRLLRLECQVFPDRVLALQFHARDFCPHDENRRKSRVRPGLADCLPRRNGGLAIRHYLGQPDPLKIQAVARALVARLQGAPVLFVTMSEAATAMLGAMS